jgi:hypothetical protein
MSIGDRVEVHPASDLFMRGMRYGEVRKVGRKWIHVRFDRWPHADVKVLPELLTVI